MEASSQQQMPPPPTPPQAQPQQHQHQQMPPPPQPPQQQPPNPNSGRGGRGRGNGSSYNGGGRGGRGGGRTASGGRSIVNVNGRGGRHSGNGGRGRGGPSHQQGGQAQKVSANSGVPFGHVPGYLPGSSSLVEELDERVMIVLRDGRHLVGNLRTFDQYSNMVLDNASERRFHSNNNNSEGDQNENEKKITYYTDVPLGMYIVRGDSIVLLGQVGSEEEKASDYAEHSIVSMKRLDNDEFEEVVASGKTVDERKDDNDAPEVEGSKSLEWDFDKDLLA